MTSRASAPPPFSTIGRRRWAGWLRVGPEVNGGDAFFRFSTASVTVVATGLLVVLGIGLFVSSRGTFGRQGLGFLVGPTWAPVHGVFGALPFAYGTLVTSGLALFLAVPVALGVAIFLAELSPRWMRGPVGLLVELSAAVPSIVYGLWGVAVLVPWLREVAEPALQRGLGWVPVFRGVPVGNGLLAAALILSLMVLPTIAAVSRDVLRAVPTGLKEGALALGATRWEMLRMVALPHARTGLLGAVLLGLGRALGEAMAVTMVIGNNPRIAASLFEPSSTMAAILANQFGEAHGPHLEALAALAFLLFILTVALNVAARLLVGRGWGQPKAEARFLFPRAP